MPSDKELVVYGRTTYCPYLDTAHEVLSAHKIAFREIMIDQDPAAAERVVAWTGFRSVPTILVAMHRQDVPFEAPALLPAGASPRGIDRGSMITEASADELTAWLKRHGFIGG